MKNGYFQQGRSVNVVAHHKILKTLKTLYKPSKFINMANKNIIDKLHCLEQKHQRQQKRNTDKTVTTCNQLKVYYGWAKINKIRKREAISVIYENEPGAGEHCRYSKTLKKSQETVFVRFQSEEESLDAIHHNRVFTEFSIFMDDKAIGGDLEKALQANFDADKNHVPEDTRMEIKELLRRNYLGNHK